MVRTRQPLLIRDHFEEETKRLGFEPIQKAGSICAVPLILYDRAIGVMAVHSPKERAFDEGHVELLRVLASEAGIAIENARLFAEEQKKSRQLTLINNVSSHAITTLNPGRNAREDRGGNRKRPDLRPHRHRHSRLFGEGAGDSGGSRRAPRRRGTPTFCWAKVWWDRWRAPARWPSCAR